MTLSFITSFPFYRIMCSFFSSLSQIILSSNFSFLLFIRFYEGTFLVPYETKVDIGIRNNRLKGLHLRQQISYRAHYDAFLHYFFSFLSYYV